MTSRERTLVTLLAVVAASALAVTASSLWFDEVGRLEAEHQAQRLAATRLISQALVVPGASKPGRSIEELEVRFWPKGSAPTVLEFSAQVRSAARRSTLVLSGLQVIEEAGGSGWVQVQAQGLIDPWLKFLGTLTQDNPRVLFRRVWIKRTENDAYSFSCEVGYATLP